MAYIGNPVDTAFTSLLKQDLTGASGQTLTLSHAVANENDIALYINNVRQEPISAYTVSNVTVNLTGTVSGTDDIYVIYLARAIQTTVPPDGSVSTAKIANSAVDLTSKVTGVLPVANGGTGISTVMADQFRITNTTNNGVNGDVSSNIERADTTGQGTLGTGMTESSGIFSFPSTGIYLVIFNVDFTVASSENNAFCNLQVTTNNSSYSTIASANSGSSVNSNNSHGANGTGMSLVNVTDISNVKVKFTTSSMDTGSSLIGDNNINRTTFTFIKLGA